ncbi:MAG TPA: STAS domain-containing protein [Spirochaetota bacterium]|nr:STAS domain-containing protein [Spirochaetota bacterium]HPJ34721.1 STAS domain-containing protein [Spirochaetota bacterium]
MFFINHKEIENGKAAIVELEGPLNSETSPDFEDYIKKLIENETVFILIDMKKLSFISSEGIGAALMLHKRITDKNGNVIFCNLNGEVTGLFRLLGFDRVFSIADTISGALDMIEDKIDNRSAGITRTEAIGISADSSEEEEELIPPDSDFTDFEEPELQDEDFEFDSGEMSEDDIEPFVIECLKCGSLVRVREKGEHICPFCEVEFNVSEDGKALFKIDEIS